MSQAATKARTNAPKKAKKVPLIRRRFVKGLFTPSLVQAIREFWGSELLISAPQAVSLRRDLRSCAHHPAPPRADTQGANPSEVDDGAQGRNRTSDTLMFSQRLKPLKFNHFNT